MISTAEIIIIAKTMLAQDSSWCAHSVEQIMTFVDVNMSKEMNMVKSYC